MVDGFRDPRWIPRWIPSVNYCDGKECCIDEPTFILFLFSTQVSADISNVIPDGMCSCTTKDL